MRRTMNAMTLSRALAPVGLLAVLLWTVGCSDRGPGPDPNPQPGDTAFVSADGQQGEDALSGRPSEDGDYGDAESGDDQRTVEEGDIYRVLGDNLILNLNAYRGVQVIDFGDPTAPRILGRAAISGHPVEMYVVGNQALVLLNNYQGYWGRRDDVQVEAYNGGLVATFDIADPGRPQLVDSARVPGWIRTSRLTRGGGKQALFVAANDWSDGQHTRVRSFAVRADGRIIERSSIDLGGYVADIQATPQALLVARMDYSAGEAFSTVSLIDISDADGFMIEGAAVACSGQVGHKSNMDLYRGVLRVVSGASFSGTRSNHLQTWDVSDIQQPQPVDHETFAAGEDLYATLFLRNKAFFVTYRRVDPFHAFSIDDAGRAEQRAEYVISGWNDFFRPVLDETRLIGIGVDDEQGWTMAVSLYDITELDNPEPFVDRAAVDAGHSWSEASQDDRAFSVLEDAVAVEGPAGSLETGLVLLPFSGYDEARQTYVAGVQIFTFSADSLTRRGVMEHGTWVRRSFQPAEQLTANLSEAALSLFDSSDPDQPEELGKVELAPNYTDLLVYGDYGARLKYSRDYYWWWGGDAELPPNELQIVTLDGDLDTAEPLATVELDSAAQVYQVGSLAVAVSMRWIDDGDDETSYRTDIQVIDLSDPTAPRTAGQLTSDQLMPYYGGWYGHGPAEDCLGCGRTYYGYGADWAYPVGQALVFPAHHWESEVVGNERVCHTWPVEQEDCRDDEQTGESCVVYTGSITCRSVDGGPEQCRGQLERCVLAGDDVEGDWSCQAVSADDIPTETDCYDHELTRTWSRLEVHVLDLRQADAPELQPVLEMPRREESAGVLADGTDFYLSYRIPYDVPGDARPYVRYYFKRIELAEPDAPVVHAGVNVPGELIAVADGGETVFTRDFFWGDEAVESAINKLAVEGGLARLLARRRYPDRQVNAMLLDGAGHALVSHRLSWQAIEDDPDLDWDDVRETLSVLDAESDELELLGEVEVDSWAWLREATAGRALYEVPGGMLVVNLDQPAQPYAQAYFPTLGWPQRLELAGDALIIPAGRYGIYRFDLNENNLQPDP